MRTPNVNDYFTKAESLFILHHEDMPVDPKWTLTELRRAAHNLYHYKLTSEQRNQLLYDAAYAGCV